MNNKDGGGTASPGDSNNPLYTDNKKSSIKYGPGHRGPFLVIIENTNERDITNDGNNVSNKDNDITNLHPIKLGRKLKQEKIPDIIRITKKGRNRLGIEFNNGKSANNFITSEFVKNMKLAASIPISLTTVKGVIRRIPEDILTEELPNIAGAAAKVISARRINRRTINQESGLTEYVPTQTIIVTFEGQQLPKEVDIAYYKSKVDIYIQPVIRCRNCLRFGHSAQTCRSKQRCAKCLKEHDKSICIEEQVKCGYCEQNHLTDSNLCPEFLRQKEIKRLMAYENISYFDAQRRIPKNYITTQSDIQSSQRERSDNYIQYTNNKIDFPALPQRNKEQQEFITHEERRNLVNQTPGTSQATYATTMRSLKRKQISTSPPEVDKKSLKEATFPSGARSQSWKTGAIYEHVEKNKKDNVEKTHDQFLSKYERQTSQEKASTLRQIVKEALKTTTLGAAATLDQWEEIGNVIDYMSVDEDKSSSHNSTLTPSSTNDSE